MGLFRLSRRIRKKIAAFRRGRSAVSAIEFGIVAFPFTFFLFAIIETGYIFLLAILLEGATADGARQIRTGVVQQAADPKAYFFDDLVCDRMAFIMQCSRLKYDVDVFASFAAARTTGLTAAVPTTQGTTFNTGNPGDIVVVRVAFQWTFITPFLENLLGTGAYGVRNLMANVVVRTEPYQ